MPASSNSRTVLVHCLNCTDKTSSGTVAAIGLIVAIIALLVAISALIYAKRQYGLASSEHAQFLRQLESRAEFTIQVRLLPNGGDTIRAPNSVDFEQPARFEIRLENTGNRAARATTLSVILPNHLQRASWTDPYGAETGERARIAFGDEFPITEWAKEQGGPPAVLTEEIGRVSHRRPATVRYFGFAVNLATVPVGRRELPIQIVARSDDLPDDVDQETTNFVLKVDLV